MAQEAGEKPGKISQQVLLKSIVDVILGDVTLLPNLFQGKFHLMEPQPGKKLILKELDDGVVIPVDRRHVIDQIVKFCHDGLVRSAKLPEDVYSISVKQAEACFELWQSLVKPLAEMPVQVLERDEPGLTFRRLPFSTKNVDIDLLRMHPDSLDPYWFVEFGTRCSNFPALCAFVGSLFVKTSDRQQYIYMFGRGQNGKGSLINWLHWVFDSAFHTEYIERNESGDNRFWTSSMLGKRLVVFPECNVPNFLQSAIMKTLTGNDPVTIEEKNKQAFTTKLNCKFMFFSNEKPGVSSEMADIRRIITCEVQPLTVSIDPAYEKKMQEQSAVFIAHCKAEYQRLCPEHGPIPCDLPAGEITDTVESRYEIFCQGAVEFYSKEIFPDADDTEALRDAKFIIASHTLHRLMQEHGITTHRDQNRCIDYMKNRYGISNKTMRIDEGGKPQRAWLGVRSIPSVSLVK